MAELYQSSIVCGVQAKTLMDLLEEVSERDYNAYFVDLFVRCVFSIGNGVGLLTCRKLADREYDWPVLGGMSACRG